MSRLVICFCLLIFLFSVNAQTILSPYTQNNIPNYSQNIPIRVTITVYELQEDSDEILISVLSNRSRQPVQYECVFTYAGTSVCLEAHLGDVISLTEKDDTMFDANDDLGRVSVSLNTNSITLGQKQGCIYEVSWNLECCKAILEQERIMTTCKEPTVYFELANALRKLYLANQSDYILEKSLVRLAQSRNKNFYDLIAIIYATRKNNEKASQYAQNALPDTKLKISLLQAGSSPQKIEEQVRQICLETLQKTIDEKTDEIKQAEQANQELSSAIKQLEIDYERTIANYEATIAKHENRIAESAKISEKIREYETKDLGFNQAQTEIKNLIIQLKQEKKKAQELLQRVSFLECLIDSDKTIIYDLQRQNDQLKIRNAQLEKILKAHNIPIPPIEKL